MTRFLSNTEIATCSFLAFIKYIEPEQRLDRVGSEAGSQVLLMLLSTTGDLFCL